jgi:DNA recombination protein RmuC
MDNVALALVLVAFLLGAGVALVWALGRQSHPSAAVTAADLLSAMGDLSAKASQIEAIGKDIASLQHILQPPQLRGALGELLLERLLAQVLPSECFGMQHRFRDGTAVDAVIRLGDYLVPVDSKFPLDAFRALSEATTDDERRACRRRFNVALRGHIDALAKYIRTDEGTLAFALMYIPAENVYYEVIVKQDLTEDDLRAYALSRRIVPVSPQSFYAYLEAIALGLKGLAVESRAQEVVDRLEALSRDLRTFQEDFRILGSHLSSAHLKYGQADRHLTQFSDRLAAAADAPLAEIGAAMAESPPNEKM